MVILSVIVLLAIVLLANVGIFESWARDSTRLLLSALNGSLALFSVWALAGADQPFRNALNDPALAEAFQKAARGLGLVGLVTAVLGTLLLLRPLRRVLIVALDRLRLSDLDLDSPVHTTMLVFGLYLPAFQFMQWLLVGGVSGLAELGGPVALGEVLLTGVLAVVFALMGVGVGVRRSWRAALERLGVGSFETGNLVLGLVGGGAMLAFVMVSSSLWYVLAPQSLEELGSANSILLGDFTSFPAALLVAVSTAVGEELLFRGALQPRLGLIPTSLLFALAHIQYTFSPAWLIILGVGLGLGLLRRWGDTTAAMLAHFTYNLALLILAMAGAG